MARRKHAHVTGTGGNYNLVLDEAASEEFGTLGRLAVSFPKFKAAQHLANAIDQYTRDRQSKRQTR